MHADSQMKASYLKNAPSTLLNCISHPSMINALSLIDAPYENYSKILGISKKERNHLIHSFFCLINKALHIFFLFNVRLKIRID